LSLKSTFPQAKDKIRTPKIHFFSFLFFSLGDQAYILPNFFSPFGLIFFFIFSFLGAKKVDDATSRV